MCSACVREGTWNNLEPAAGNADRGDSCTLTRRSRAPRSNRGSLADAPFNPMVGGWVCWWVGGGRVARDLSESLTMLYQNSNCTFALALVPLAGLAHPRRRHRGRPREHSQAPRTGRAAIESVALTALAAFAAFAPLAGTPPAAGAAGSRFSGQGCTTVAPSRD